jgi:hypothetical protein
MRECDDFKAWLTKNGNDIISFFDESFFTNFFSHTWWIDCSATVHVINSSQEFLTAQTIIRKRSLQVVGGREAKVEDVGTLPLLLHGNFTFTFFMYHR